MKLLCKYLAGSISYGLDGPDSDLDYRGVFINTDISKLIGLDRYEHQDNRKGDADEFYYELCHFLCLLRKTNTQSLEILFNNNFLEMTNEFQLITQNKFQLMDSERQFKSLMGYIHNERRLALGERTGLLGGKRREALNKYGYSYKNMVQLFRLIYCGQILFQRGYFPVNIQKDNPELAKFLRDIKFNPENYNPNELDKLIQEKKQELEKDFNNRNFNYKFNKNIANEICFQIYMKELEKHK